MVSQVYHIQKYLDFHACHQYIFMANLSKECHLSHFASQKLKAILVFPVTTPRPRFLHSHTHLFVKCSWQFHQMCLSFSSCLLHGPPQAPCISHRNQCNSLATTHPAPCWSSFRIYSPKSHQSHWLKIKSDFDFHLEL